MPMEDVLPCHSSTYDPAGEACAICFETRPSMTLPCACKATYCRSCWNRAMASSVKRRGQAQCPSCRMAFCVDLDPDTGHLLFSKQDATMNQDRWQPRLSSKAKVVQIRLLKTYGSKIKQQVAAANDSTNAPCIGATAKSLNESAKDPMSGITYHMLHKPTCVCGGSLEHVTYRKRFSSLREDFAVDWRHRVSYVISCNLCDTVVPQKGSLWTCEDGCRSVLHPASHDICEPCFSKHASLKSGSRSIFLFKWPW